MSYIKITRNPDNTYTVSGPDGGPETFPTHAEAATRQEQRTLAFHNAKTRPASNDDSFDD
jgi:hypothetical protein